MSFPYSVTIKPSFDENESAHTESLPTEFEMLLCFLGASYSKGNLLCEEDWNAGRIIISTFERLSKGDHRLLPYLISIDHLVIIICKPSTHLQ